MESAAAIEPSTSQILELARSPDLVAGESTEIEMSALTERDVLEIASGAPSMSLPQQELHGRKQKAHVRFLALCWSLFLIGWNDGSTGPLLPRIQSVYHVRESTLWVLLDSY